MDLNGSFGSDERVHPLRGRTARIVIGVVGLFSMWRRAVRRVDGEYRLHELCGRHLFPFDGGHLVHDLRRRPRSSRRNHHLRGLCRGDIFGGGGERLHELRSGLDCWVGGCVVHTVQRGNLFDGRCSQLHQLRGGAVLGGRRPENVGMHELRGRALFGCLWPHNVDVHGLRRGHRVLSHGLGDRLRELCCRELRC
jgi:hypothetical protein